MLALVKLGPFGRGIGLNGLHNGWLLSSRCKGLIGECYFQYSLGFNGMGF
jgi:hypothetical protein